MNDSNSKIRQSWPIIAVAAFCCLIVGYAVWPLPNESARRQVGTVLLDTSTATQQQLDQLADFVQVGDHIDDVRSRLSPDPANEEKGVKRQTEWSLGLQGVNLELAIEADGRVVGIGRHIHDTDDGVVWLSPPEWYSIASQEN